MWAFVLLVCPFDVMLVWLGCFWLLMLFYQVVCIGLMPLFLYFRGGAARFSFFLEAFGFLFCP